MNNLAGEDVDAHWPGAETDDDCDDVDTTPPERAACYLLPPARRVRLVERHMRDRSAAYGGRVVTSRPSAARWPGPPYLLWWEKTWWEKTWWEKTRWP
jgi:hypothetical protein